MNEEQVPDTVVERLKTTFAKDGALALTPHNVATTLRTLGWPVGDAAVIQAYEQLRMWRYGPKEEDPVVTEAKAFLQDHNMYDRWKDHVREGRTLGGFFEWREQQ